MRSKLSKERGQALIIIAFAIIGLVGMVGLAIDGGSKFSDRRHAQNAADTAALAAALAKVDALIAGVSDKSPTTNAVTTCPPPSGVLASPVCDALQLAGLDRAASNGYGNNLTSNTVEIHSPPISGYYSTIVNSDEYVQVIIDSNVNTTFSRVFGFNQFKNHVEAVSLAKPGYNLAEGAMIISYDPDPYCSTTGTGGYSVSVNGSSTVNLIGGGIFLNSDETCGFKIPSCADLNIINGGGINTVGANNIDTGSCTFDPPINKNYNQEPVKIPDDLYWPPVPKECSMSGSPAPKFLGTVMVDRKEVEEWLIYPGFYPQFPQATLLPTEEEVTVGKKSRIYMASGVYCIDPPHDQDLSWNPDAASILVGSTSSNPSDVDFNKYHAYNPNGVTLYIRKGGGFKINLSSPTFLDATTKAPNGSDSDYQGYLVILEGIPTDHPACVINGGADVVMNGLIFAPYCDFTLNGGGDEVAPFNAQIIGWDILIDGKNGVNFNYDPSNQVKVKRRVGLMK